MRFVDKVRIYAQAGRGGNGCLSFHREKYVEKGGPDGADGGRGGDIIFRADPHMGTLLDFSHRPNLEAAPGGGGKSSNKTGANADPLIVRVPVGTVVYKGKRVVADLSAPGSEVLALRGGRGGRGNMSFKCRQNSAPQIYEKGEPGEEAELDLELKLIADVGLAGFPNAGKSTFLARVSNARPKIADYPFTTLAPHLGLVAHKESSFVMADIPGLIEGAHEGKGLGLDFLRHVERTRLLVHLIDPLGYAKTPPLEGILKIEEELKLHSKILSRKPRVLVVNKLDLPEGKKVLAAVKARYRKRKVFGISAFTGEGMSPLLDYLTAQLHRLPRETHTLDIEADDVVRVDPGFAVRRIEEGLFEVTGRYITRLAAMADLNLYESRVRLQQALHKIGVDKALRAAGVKEGDFVRLGEELELEWSEEQAQRPGNRARRPEATAARLARGPRPRAARHK